LLHLAIPQQSLNLVSTSLRIQYIRILPSDDDYLHERRKVLL